MAYGFGWQKVGNQRIVGLGPERLPGPSANKSLYGRPCLQGTELPRDDRRVRHEFQPGGSANEITPSAHVIMVIIAPWTEPFLTYLTRQELPEDQNEARCIVRRSKAYRVHEGELYKKALSESFKGASPKRKGGSFG